MPSINQRNSSQFVKLLALGDSKSGKTSSLVSLVDAGYKLRILDLDNLLDPLEGLIQRQCPDKADNVECCTIRDKMKAGPIGPIVTPKAFTTAYKMIDKWKYKVDEENVVDLGSPAEWGEDCVLVIDSLSRLCDAAYDHHEPLTPTGKGGESDPRATYGMTQDAIEKILAWVTSDTFGTNVIVIAHLIYMDIMRPEGDSIKKAFPQGMGQKLSPRIPQYFPNIIHYYNNAGKRKIRTTSTPLLDLANPKPFEIDKEYPTDTGLAEIFSILRNQVPVQPKLREVK